MPFNGNGWRPTRFMSVVWSVETSTTPVRVDTDAGEGFLKALGNPEGPHALACEFVGNMLAEWMGLTTFDFAIMELTEDDEIQFANGDRATPGPAFISRALDGFSWGGDSKQLKSIVNPLEITGLVVLDTWTLNDDRYAPGGGRANRSNVFFVKSPGRTDGDRIVAMDFTHAFRHGQDINRKISFIERIQDTRVYGLFPEFKNFLNREEMQRLLRMLDNFDRATAEAIIRNIPSEWEVDGDGRSALATLITERAHFVAHYLESELWPEQLEFEGGTV